MARVFIGTVSLFFGLVCMFVLSHVAGKALIYELEVEDYTTLGVWLFLCGLSFIIFIANEDWPDESKQWEVPPNDRVHSHHRSHERRRFRGPVD